MTQITGPLKEPLEYLATLLDSDAALEIWMNIIHDFLEERMRT